MKQRGRKSDNWACREMDEVGDAGSITGAELSKGIPCSIPSSGPWWQHNLLIITPSAWPQCSSITQPFVLLGMLSRHSWNSHFLLDLHGNSHKTILKMSGETASNGAASAKENILQF